jgi:hypothetical protein
MIARRLGVKLRITGATNDKTSSRRDRRRVSAGGVGAFAVAACVAMAANASPAAAAYWYGGWYGGWHKHKSAHKQHESKSAEPAGKDPFPAVSKGPQQIFISINQQKLHLYSDGVHVADTSIATGVSEHPTPLGVFSIIQKQIFHRSNIYSNAPMPYMQRVTWSGVAMHEGQNIGHPASHGCIRMPHDFAVQLYRFTKLNTRVIIARAELKPVEFVDSHLFVHKEKPPEIAAPATAIEPVVAKPAELAVHANTLTSPVQSDVVTPQAATPTTNPDQKAEAAAPAPDAGTPGAAAVAPPPAPPTPADLAKIAAGKKIPVSIFVSRKRQRLYVRQNFEPLFDVPVTIAEPEAPLGTHVFTALDFSGPERTTLRWNVVSLPGEPPKRIRHVEEHRDHHGRLRRREIEEERTGDAAPPQSPAQVLARIEIAPEVGEAIAQMIGPGSALIVSDQGLGDETGEGTDFDVVTR